MKGEKLPISRHNTDLTWGDAHYPVTKTQKQALEAIWYVMGERTDWFYILRKTDGAVILGRRGRSVTVYRTGRITSNKDYENKQLYTEKA